MNAKRFFYILLGCLGAMLIVFGVGYKLGLNKLGEQKDDISKLKAQIAAVDEKLSITISTEAKLEQLSFIDTIANEVLPQEKFQPELVSQVLLIARRNNVTINSMTFSNQNINEKEGKLVIPSVTQATSLKEAPGVYTVPIVSNLTADYEDFLKFLEGLETNRRKVQVQSINLNPIKDENDRPTGKISATITLDVYVKP